MVSSQAKDSSPSQDASPTLADSRRPRLFDTHIHLTDEQFAGTLPAILARSRAAGVDRWLSVGTTVVTSRECLALAQRETGVHAAVGIHPNYVAEAASDDWGEIERLAASASVVAIGETGLDRHWDYAPFALQQDYFARHLDLSRSTGKPFIVHMRDCQADVLEMLREARRAGPLCGIMHSFAGTVEAMRECVELGLHISFSGMATYKKSDDLRAIAAETPAERLLLETDAPYLSPHPCRSQRPNEPALMVHTAVTLAQVRGVELAELARLTTSNALCLFGLPSGD